MKPERLAAASRLLQTELFEAIALASDGIADDLGERLGMVAWEREEQIGVAQRRLLELRERRFHRYGGEPVRVRELREQPLEAFELAWRALRRGREVHVESEADACPAVYRILRELAELLEGGLRVSPPGQFDHAQRDWPLIGVRPRQGRVALIQADADRELAAYVLARACLRRTGYDPRVVHRVLVVGPLDRLERNLRRLWVGARMGPVTDERAFAGPVDEPRAAAFLASEAAWRAREGVSCLCPGGLLERADAPGLCFLAPALVRVPALDDASQGSSPEDLPPEPELVGPILALYPITGAAAAAHSEALLEHLSPRGHGHLRFGAKPRNVVLQHDDRQIHGALLVERLAPGLPEPRP
jgi:hypothetical protein